MKLGIFIGIAIGMVLVAAAAAAVFVLAVLPTTREFQNAVQTATPYLPSAPPAITSPIPGVKPATPAAPASTAAATGPVKFNAEIISISGTDLTRAINAQLSNTGTADAHNVSARVQVTSLGTTVKLDGQDYLSQSFGTLKAGAATTLQRTVSVNLIDGLRIFQNGASVILTISSDEATQTSTYNYPP